MKNIQELIDYPTICKSFGAYLTLSNRIKRDGFEFIGEDKDNWMTFRRNKHEIIKLKCDYPI